MQTQIHFLKIDNKCLPSCFNELLSVVSDRKQKYIHSLKFDIDKKLSLYSDIIVRYNAVCMLGITNSKLSFYYNCYGKPYLKNTKSFYFNISHTRSAVAVVISAEEVGVDIERIIKAPFGVARRCFAKDEIDYIFCDDVNSTKRFYEVWTKKEAYVKNMGKGLSIPTNSFSIFEIKQPIFSYERNDYIIAVCTRSIDKIINRAIDEEQTIELTRRLKDYHFN